MAQNSTVRVKQVLVFGGAMWVHFIEPQPNSDTCFVPSVAGAPWLPS